MSNDDRGNEKKKRRWKQIAPANLPDPRVSTKSKEYGKRFVPGSLAIDDDGQLWELDAAYTPRLIGRPPENGDPDQ